MSRVRPRALTPAPALRVLVVAGTVSVLAGCGSPPGHGGAATPVPSVEGSGWFVYAPTGGPQSPTADASWTRSATPPPGPTSATTTGVGATGTTAMTPDQFWAVVGRVSDQDTAAAAAKLATELEAMTPERIVAYEAQFVAQMARANTQHHRGAAEVILGFTSEDVFVGFRTWVLYQGRAVYDAFVADPDSLAAHGPSDDEQIATAELLEFAAVEAWQARTGRDPYAEGSGAPDGGDVYDEPTGTPVDPSQLASRYPRLTAAYVGGDPSNGPAPVRTR